MDVSLKKRFIHSVCDITISIIMQMLSAIEIDIQISKQNYYSIVRKPLLHFYFLLVCLPPISIALFIHHHEIVLRSKCVLMFLSPFLYTFISVFLGLFPMVLQLHLAVPSRRIVRNGPGSTFSDAVWTMKSRSDVLVFCIHHGDLFTKDYAVNSCSYQRI